MADHQRTLLELQAITKTFPGTKALDEVCLSVREGEIVVLLGENGAGKSTLMKILSGVWPSGSFKGQVRVGSLDRTPVPMAFFDTRDAHAAGIAMIHQELSVFPELTVAEHLELDHLPRWINWNDLFARTQKFLDRLELGLKASAKVGDLSIGGRQLVEIARALYRNANILVFDEPTSALTEQEVQKLYTILDRLKADKKGIIYITHRMDEVFHLADRMVVLRDGKNAGEATAWENEKKIPRAVLEPKLITWMVGRAIEDIYPSKNKSIGAEALRVTGWNVRSPRKKVLVRDLSFSIKKGEVVGLAGLLGAGRSETLESVFGVFSEHGPRSRGYEFSGDIWIHGVKKSIADPAAALNAKMAFVSEDRKGSGLVLKHTIRSNMSLPSLVAGRSGIAGTKTFSPVSELREREKVNHWTLELKIKSASMDQTVSQLSGGNQQKVVLSKWLMTDPDILFLDEPTRGIDIGAKVEIYQWIQKLASTGMAIVVASSEMPEVLGLCHRVLVFREGKLSAEFGAEATQEKIMRAAAL